MPLFECSQCGAVDNTALGNFWERESKGLLRLCTECDEGKWHGVFPKRNAKEAGHVPRGKDRFLVERG